MSIDEYIQNFNEDVKTRLSRMRELVKQEAPDAEESISYGLIAYKLRDKPLVYFGGFKSHIGFYATPNGHDAFREDFSKYKQGKGSVQFPLNEPLPEELITRVIAYRKEQV